LKPLKSTKLRQSARTRDCTMRIPSVCNFNSETVVLCHVSTKGSKGMSQKNDDSFAFFGCSNCHQWFDQRTGDPLERAEAALAAVSETQSIWINEGLLITK